jgi:hypothetical protein
VNLRRGSPAAASHGRSRIMLRKRRPSTARPLNVDLMPLAAPPVSSRTALLYCAEAESPFSVPRKIFESPKVSAAHAQNISVSGRRCDVRARVAVDVRDCMAKEKTLREGRASLSVHAPLRRIALSTGLHETPSDWSRSLYPQPSTGSPDQDRTPVRVPCCSHRTARLAW